MKRCPLCRTEYPDTFRICPQDGGKLDDETVVIEAPTVPISDWRPPVPEDAMLGRTIAGRFKIERKLGEGGMGAVYKAEHVKMNRPCAIKILSSSALNDPEALPRFTREAQMSSRIDHPNAVTIYDYGESEDGLVYLAMEYLEGETLTKVLEREGKFSIERSIKIARQIGDALEAAHGLTIVHRDLKPDNIMLTAKGGGDFVKVLDFGIAKMTETEDKRNDLTQAGLIIGTPYYMSPEQVSGEKLDARSDIFSFGLIVYEMLTGELPFGGQNTQAVMVSRLTTSPRPLRAVNPAVPPAVEVAVMHALERERNVRTSSAGQLVFELEEALAGRGPDLSKMQTKASTHPQPRPDTASFHSPMPTPPSLNNPTMPVESPGPFTPQPQPPIYPTDRAPHPQGYGQTAVEPGPFAPPPPMPIPQPVYHPTPPPPTPYPTYPPQPAPKKGGGGVGIWIGLVFVVILLGGVAAVGVFGYTQGWFTKSTTGGPPTGGPTNAGPTDTASAEQIFQEGYELQKRSDNAGAIEKYRAAIARQPNFPKAHRNLGAALVNSKRYDEGIRELETAIEQDPTPNDQVYYNLGLAYFKLENYSKSGDYFKRAAAIGTDPDAYALAGFALENANNQADADEAYKKYMEKQPTGRYADLIKGIIAGRASVPTADDVEF